MPPDETLPVSPDAALPPSLEPPSLEATLPSGHEASDRDDPPSAPDRGERFIDRYVVLSKLGTGAMGVVLAAYDPQLDRKVAIKLLKSLGPSSDAARARLQREAQALAKLDHRNVVGVHDVGVHDGELFVAMELVVGQTLRAWMEATDAPRPWREVVRVLSEAGRGLAAAHGAGLVHRDFKPDNVMIGDDDRVRVMDFGLARTQAEAEPELPNRLGMESGTQAEANDALTRTGMLMGTPAYMSPEQFAARAADARSDQFSFCVTLYEALYGERPFRGDGLMALIAALERGEIGPPPAGAKVPAWLRRVVVRGLSRDPEQRHESMGSLRDALAADPALRRRQQAAVVGLAGLLGLAVWGLSRSPETCVGMAAPLVDVWDPARQATLRAAFDAVELPYAEHTRDKVLVGLDDYAQRWVASRVEVCTRTQRGEQSGELLDLRMACLDERLQHLDALVDVLGKADRTVVGQAIRAVTGLPELQPCVDLDAVTNDIAPPNDPELATRVADLDARLITARALEKAGKYADGLVLADAVVAELPGIDYPPLRARAQLRRGSLQYFGGDSNAAAITLTAAYDVALGNRDLRTAAEASMRLAWIVGYGLARYEIGRTWAASADPLTRAIADERLRGTHFHSIASVALAEGKLDEARALFERAIEILEREFGPDHLELVRPLSGLAISIGQQGEHEQARALLQRAMTIVETTLGPGHPELADLLNNLGNMAGRQGELGLAHASFERALTIQEATLGSEHPNLAAPLDNLGTVAQLEHDLEAARRYFDRALAIRERSLGPTHPSVARTLDNLATIALNERRFEDARALNQRSLTISETTQGSEHPDLAYPLLGLGNSLQALGDARAALPFLERAVALRTAHGIDPLEVARARYDLARALADTGELTRARSLAQLARTTMAEAGEGHAKVVEDIDAWLAAHPP